MAERASIDRREFLTTLILIPIGAKLAGCGGDESPSPGNDGGCSGLDAQSTEFGSHTHCLCIPREDLDDPPTDGREYDTDQDCALPNEAHSHTVTLSQADLTMIADGGTVTVTTSKQFGHTHGFTLAKANANQDAGAAG